MIKEHSCPKQSFQHTPLRAELTRCSADHHRIDAADPPDRETKRGWRVRNILAPTDFSACSLEAVAHAAALARQYDATLTILHVIDSNPPAAFTHCGPAENLMRQLWVTGISELSRLKEALARNMTQTRTVIVEGIPAESINENSPGFDLLVLSPQCSKPARRFFSRHTARRVMERAQCPVLVAPQEPGLVGFRLPFEAKALV